MNASISFAVICAVIALGSQIWGILNDHKKNTEEEKREKVELEKNLLRLDLKLDNLSQLMTSLLKNDEQTTNELKTINESIIKSNESLKAAWRKIDNHEERITNLEKEINKHE